LKRVFVDTNYLLAVVSERDPLHHRAMAASEEISSADRVEFVTTLYVLSEFLAHFSKDAYMRERAAQYVDRLRSSPDVTVLSPEEKLFDAAFDLYRHRSNKTYSLVDCMSMVICRRMKITEVLTGDRDFQQEGFAILL
jgi:hypothetical protein